jgi:hypothetical protein
MDASGIAASLYRLLCICDYHPMRLERCHDDQDRAAAGGAQPLERGGRGVREAITDCEVPS